MRSDNNKAPNSTSLLLSQPSLPVSAAMRSVHAYDAGECASCRSLQPILRVCLCVCVCPPCYEWAAYQSWSKEHSQQCQACSHHYEQQEHYERMLLAHTVVGLIKPIWGPGPNVLTPSSSSSSSISFTKLPCPFEEVALSPYCFLPHGSGSWKGGRGERETGGGRGDGHCWDVSSFHHRRTVAPLHSPAVVVPVEDHAASSPDPPLRFLPHLLFKVLQAETTGSCVGVRDSLHWPEGWHDSTEGWAQHPPLSPPANMLKQ